MKIDYTPWTSKFLVASMVDLVMPRLTSSHLTSVTCPEFNYVLIL